jgi:hypothetical protein
MDSLADYRARHAIHYNLRMKEEQEKAAQIAAKLAEEQAERDRITQFNNSFIKKIDDLSIIILICDLPSVMVAYLTELNNDLETHITKWNDEKDVDMMKKLGDVIMKVFESVNQNNITKINFNNREDVNASKLISQTMNSILSKVGIQHEDDNLEVEYEMDCTADEEFARQLYLNEQAAVNHIPPNFMNNAAQPTRRQRRARQPQAGPDPNVDGVQPVVVPRPRGRPRRNPTAN